MEKTITTTLGSKTINPRNGVEVFSAGKFNEKEFFKDEKAFRKDGLKICYFSHEEYEQYYMTLTDIQARWENGMLTRRGYNRELTAAAYTHGLSVYDLIKMCGENRDFAQFVFDSLKGESPQEFISSLTFGPEDFSALGLKHLSVKNFFFLEEWERKDITDSLLLPSGQEVLSGKYGDIKVIVETQGHVKIAWKGEYYNWVGNFPDDLVEAIKNGTLGTNPDAEILENNWYEVLVYRGNELLCSDVIDIDLHDMSEMDAKSLIIDIAQEYIKPKRGSIIRIDKMADKDGSDWQATAMNGKVGYVRVIDSAGQLFGSWGGLAVIPELDKYAIL